MRNHIIDSNGGRRQSRPVINDNQMPNILLRGRGSLTKAGHTTARGWESQRLGIIKTKKAVLVMAVCLLAGVGFSGAQAVETKPVEGLRKPGDSNNVAAKAPVTNSATAKIQADLDSVKSKINAAVKQIQDAVAANEAQRALAVSNLAAQIRTVAVTDLGDNSALVKETEKLIEKMRTQVSRGHNLSADPREQGREIYAPAVRKLEEELAALIDKRLSVAAVRSELQRQANALESKARAIAFAEDAELSIVAANALGDVLTEVLAFAGRVETLINKMGSGPRMAIE